jgi:hypothetical protein
MLFGAVSAVTNHSFKAFRHLGFLVGALVVHDGFLLPIFLLIGLVVHRLVPARSRGVVQAALIATAAVTFVAMPFVLGYGRLPDNPSALPRDYTAGYLIVLGAIWLTAAISIAVRHRHRATGS